ncbi:RNA polymerase sigma factor [Kribbella sp. NPDC023855]|uniref:RNA polymerase sigma factor n=1 Tax=Kribbella sp. NPDC023855 TaxID=3154698 RepID=UPI0033F60EA0
MGGRPPRPGGAGGGGRRGAPPPRDDIVQEALTRAWLKRDQYDGSRGTASAWLLAITADQARKAVRRLRPVAELTDHDQPVRRADVEARVDVDQALAELSPRQRLAVDCYYFADLSIADTAAVMDCSEGTVKSTLSDARARLRSLLEVSE